MGVLLPLSRDTGARKFLCPGTKGQRDIPSCGNANFNSPLIFKPTTVHRVLMPTSGQRTHKLICCVALWHGLRTPNEGINQKQSEILGRCGRRNILWPYLTIWDWDLTFGRAAKAISSPGVRSPWAVTLKLQAACAFHTVSQKQLKFTFTFFFSESYTSQVKKV